MQHVGEVETCKLRAFGFGTCTTSLALNQPSGFFRILQGLSELEPGLRCNRAQVVPL